MDDPLYRHAGVALLRAAVLPLTEVPDQWPDLADGDGCRRWLESVRSRPVLATAIRQASRSLAARVDALCSGVGERDRHVRRATLATARYVLRATGRATPFGLFAGVAPAGIGREPRVRWGDSHDPISRVDMGWLADVVDQLEACGQLLERLDVVVNDLAVRRGDRLEVPAGPERVTIRFTSVVDLARESASLPIHFGLLVEKVADAWPAAGHHRIRDLLRQLVRHRFLITSLRAPFTRADPMAYLIHQLRDVEAASIPSIAALVEGLDSIQADVHRHNTATPLDRDELRESITRRMRRASDASRAALATDLRLDCDLQVPAGVAHDMERAASVLLRLSRQPAGDPRWHDFHVAFLARYGTGTAVPVLDVVDPDTGLGYPAGYPGSTRAPTAGGLLERDARLLELAWAATADGRREVLLTDADIDALAGHRDEHRPGPPHVELLGRLQATDIGALQRGDYTINVRPGRAAGTFTSRFASITGDPRMVRAYQAVPAATAGAQRVQMSFGAAYPYAENICRVSPYLPDVLSFGEHRQDGDRPFISVHDLAVTATRERLYLVSHSHRHVVEPLVFHALALEKQPPPVVRFIAELPWAFLAAWHEFDWGPAAEALPYLPRVRYRRAILSPARWRVTSRDLPPKGTDATAWHQGFAIWRRRWRCPTLVELRNADLSLRLDLDEPFHRALLRTHLDKEGHAALVETVTAPELGWIGGRAHEIALPLVTARAPIPAPRLGPLPLLSNRTHGHLPGSPDAAWCDARVFAHPDRHDEIIAAHLPGLAAALGDEAQSLWFVRYRSPTESHHLRLRIRTPDAETYSRCALAVGRWAYELRERGLAGRLVLDTYNPETGRYGQGGAMEAAEAVFASDSRLVAALLRNLPDESLRQALVVASMAHIAHALCGDPASGWRRLVRVPVPAGPTGHRPAATAAVRLAGVGLAALRDLKGWTDEFSSAWQARARALDVYRQQLPVHADLDDVVSSVLHMHHNRAVGIDPDSELRCRRLVRQAALRWQVRHDGSTS
jgi:lantibiotic biosynthesis protein